MLVQFQDIVWKSLMSSIKLYPKIISLNNFFIQIWLKSKQKKLFQKVWNLDSSNKHSEQHLGPRHKLNIKSNQICQSKYKTNCTHKIPIKSESPNLDSKAVLLHVIFIRIKFPFFYFKFLMSEIPIRSFVHNTSKNLNWKF